MSSVGVTIQSIPTASGSSAHFEYVIRGNTGGMRAGVVMSVWNDAIATYTDNSTPDLDGSTTALSFEVRVSGSNVILVANAASGTWTIKVGTRIIF